ncbi:MAG TPA: hypothetical protein VK760_14465 [Candidatus Acidoferrales bacterium]|jgi:hypothetical protein|nr:hypothetical protein [Candidatus Acidoferrales bacterium]
MRSRRFILAGTCLALSLFFLAATTTYTKTTALRSARASVVLAVTPSSPRAMVGGRVLYSVGDATASLPLSPFDPAEMFDDTSLRLIDVSGIGYPLLLVSGTYCTRNCSFNPVFYRFGAAPPSLSVVPQFAMLNGEGTAPQPHRTLGSCFTLGNPQFLYATPDGFQYVTGHLDDGAFAIVADQETAPASSSSVLARFAHMRLQRTPDGVEPCAPAVTIPGWLQPLMAEADKQLPAKAVGWSAIYDKAGGFIQVTACYASCGYEDPTFELTTTNDRFPRPDGAFDGSLLNATGKLGMALSTLQDAIRHADGFVAMKLSPVGNGATIVQESYRGLGDPKKLYYWYFLVQDNTVTAQLLVS